MNYKDPEVLKWVNEIRAKDGRKPLKRICYAKRLKSSAWYNDDNGHVKWPVICNCPIARSLGEEYYCGTHYYHKLDYNKIPLPPKVSEWIKEFDSLEP